MKCSRRVSYRLSLMPQTKSKQLGRHALRFCRFPATVAEIERIQASAHDGISLTEEIVTAKEERKKRWRMKEGRRKMVDA